MKRRGVWSSHRCLPLLALADPARSNSSWIYLNLIAKDHNAKRSLEYNGHVPVPSPPTRCEARIKMTKILCNALTARTRTEAWRNLGLEVTRRDPEF